MVSRLVVTLTIRPQPASVRWGRIALASRKGAIALVSMMVRQRSSVTSQNFTRSM